MDRSNTVAGSSALADWERDYDKVPVQLEKWHETFDRWKRGARWASRAF